MTQKQHSAIFACVLFGGLINQLCASERERVPADLYDHLNQASVEVLVERRLAGSGCMVDPQGIVLTAAHIFNQPDQRIEAMSPTFGRMRAELIAVDQGHDLALLRVPRREREYPHLTLANQMPKAGRTIYLFGAPLFRHGVMIRGSVARNGTTFEFVDGHYAEVFHVCAPTAKGVSGGPWVNERGDVIGVQSSHMSLGNSQQGIAFTAPIHAIRQLLDSKTSARTPTIGAAVEEIWEQPPEPIKKLDENATGLVVRLVKKDGPLAKAGVMDGELITSIDGQAIQFRDQLLRKVRNHKVGKKTKLSLLDQHGKNRREVTIGLSVLEHE